MPVFLRWPLPAEGKAYGTIDGARLWQYVKAHGDIAERYRQQRHPQFWGIIAGTSGDADEAQWLLGKYTQIGLTNAHIQTVAFFHPQWAPESWDVVATGSGSSMPLTSAQPAYATTATNGNPLDVPAVYVGLGSEADMAGGMFAGRPFCSFAKAPTPAPGPSPCCRASSPLGRWRSS